MGQRLWIVDDAIAYVEDGRVTLQVSKPTRHLPRAQAYHVADKIWFAGQMGQLDLARRRGDTKEIPLTDRRRRSSLRLGGGFMITQGHKLVVVRRQLDAPRPGQLCECGGVYEFMGHDFENDPTDVRNDFVASLLKESQEIALVRGDTLYVPQLAPSPGEQLGFQPPGALHAYNAIMEEELKHEAQKACLPINPSKVRKFWMKLLEYDQAITLEFAYSPPLSVEVTAELDTSSLECVGVLSYPENIDKAVEAFLEEEILVLSRKKDSEADEAKRLQLVSKIEEMTRHLEDIKREDGKRPPIEYWDTELGWDPIERKEGGPVDREVHIIDTEDGGVVVWHTVEGERKREARDGTTIWEELSATKLGPGGTGGRLATEKLERAVKMHCPFTRLQPLVTF